MGSQSRPRGTHCRQPWNLERSVGDREQSSASMSVTMCANHGDRQSARNRRESALSVLSCGRRSSSSLPDKCEFLIKHMTTVRLCNEMKSMPRNSTFIFIVQRNCTVIKSIEPLTTVKYLRTFSSNSFLGVSWNFK